jgi:acetyl-CoA synthetase
LRPEKEKWFIVSKNSALEFKLREIAARIRELREIEGLTDEDMARETGVSPGEYLACEAGNSDLNFAFLYRCALALNVDITDIIEGASPTLTSYTITRNGAGQRIEQAHGMIYYNLAHSFKNRTTEPLRVTAVFDPEAEHKEIEVTTHAGQECDIVLKGSLKIKIGDHTELLHEGDTIYYDSSTPHGMIAAGGQDCIFYAIVINPPEGFVSNAASHDGEVKTERIAAKKVSEPDTDRVYKHYICPVEDENGCLTDISFKNEESFNFAFDVVDAIASKHPEKLAMLHIDRHKTERRFTFGEISRLSSRAANFYRSLGIKKGDRVMLVLRRHYQFWISVIALHKLGAVVIPATDQLLQKDFEYRFKAAGVSAIVCTGVTGAADEAEQAFESCPFVTVRVMVEGRREGWRSFDDEYELFRGTFPRTEDTACGSDPMLMFFTSGTTGYPKIALHNFKYPLGHFVTAHYWQCVDPDGLHLTISDTGWAKSMWGKLYGQWLCEAANFVYDFDRFDANDILPMFRKYNITTFCAPPTMYRFMIKEDLSKFDLSSIKHASIAGEALNPEVFNQFKKATGIPIMEGFGQSESTVMIGNFRGMTSKIGSLGKPTPLYPIDLIDGDGNSVGVGETGEIVIRTKPGEICGLSIEYYGDKKATDNAWAGGVYHTGDTAWRDEEGYIWYVGRVDDLIKSSGYRIGPFEIESVIMELPYVLECGVSPEPDEIRGQVVKASIVLTRGTEPSNELAKEIQEYVKKHTAPYKYPRVVVFKDELPKTISGKIQRNKL